MRNMFLEKSYTKYCEETSPRRFSEKLKLNLSLDKQSKVLYSLFLLYGKFRAFKIYCNSAADHLLSPYIKLFEKIKRGLELVFLPHFLHNFWRKIFLLLYSINWPNFIVWLPLLCEILGNMCIAIVCKPGWTSWIFKSTLSFWSSRFSYMTKKSWQKPKCLENEKSF